MLLFFNVKLKIHKRCTFSLTLHYLSLILVLFSLIVAFEFITTHFPCFLLSWVSFLLEYFLTIYFNRHQGNVEIWKDQPFRLVFQLTGNQVRAGVDHIILTTGSCPTHSQYISNDSFVSFRSEEFIDFLKFISLMLAILFLVNYVLH